jgi:hypothetical protein
LLKIVAPLVPHLAEEINQALPRPQIPSIFAATWNDEVCLKADGKLMTGTTQFHQRQARDGRPLGHKTAGVEPCRIVPTGQVGFIIPVAKADVARLLKNASEVEVHLVAHGDVQTLLTHHGTVLKPT